MFIWVALKGNSKSMFEFEDFRSVFELRISAGATEKMSETKATGKPDAETTSSWSYDMEGRAKQCVERYCELANKTTEQLYKVATPCTDDHQFKEVENEICWRIVTSMLSNCSKMLKLGTNWKT